MRFETPLHEGVLRARYKRFFADVETQDGRTITVHCANTGSMRGCSTTGSRVAFSLHQKPERKLPGALELVWCDGQWVGVHPLLANRIVAEACAAGAIPHFRGLDVLRREVVVAGCTSRFDLALGVPSADAKEPEWLVEVKSVSWAEQGSGRFPDAKSARARRHADELAQLARAGAKVAMLFCVQRSDVHEVQPAWDVDPEYGHALVAAVAAGVVVAAFSCNVSLEAINLAGELPVVLDR